MRHETAHRALRVFSRIVPADRRREWLEEWEGELHALAGLHASRSRNAYPGTASFIAGALPHALWMRTEGWTVDSILQDLHFAVRWLRRAPGFTLIAALTLALGIGANGWIFSLINGLVLRPPAAIGQPDRLVQIARSYDSAPRWDNWSYPALELIGRDTRTFSGVAGYQTQAFVLGSGADAEQLAGQYVTGNYFHVLGVRPFLGRLVQPSDDDVPGAHPVVVLSHGLWLRRFGGDPGVVGRSVLLGTQSYEVVGVAPDGFTGPDALGATPSLWIPMKQFPALGGRLPFDQWGWSWINAVGRLADGVSFQAASASMQALSMQLREAWAPNRDIRVLVANGVGLSPDEQRDARQMSKLLLGIVLLVLVLACTNVANLFLARASSRSTEMGVRRALGARRVRIARQLVTECLLLALLATAIAIPAVILAGRALPAFIPYATSVSLAPDAGVFVFLAVVGIVAGLLFGVAPAWSAARTSLSDVLREGRPTGRPARGRLRDVLVVAQLALSLGLVAGAALLGRSILNARSADPGFRPDGLVSGFIDLQSTGRYDVTSGRELAGRLLSAVERVPGVTGVTLANEAPIAGGHSRATARPAGRDDIDTEAEFIVAGPRYFETMGIPLVRGRALGGLTDETGRVVVVNEALARLFWPGEDAVGKELAGEGGNWRVVGLVRDVQMRSLRAKALPAVYYPLSQVWSSRLTLQVRAGALAASIGPTLRAAVADLDPALRLVGVTDLREATVHSLGSTRPVGILVGVFAVLALVLAAIGLYGVVAFAVSQRSREMGIRLALGAEPAALVRVMMSRGVRLTIVGVVVGLGVSIAVGRALQGLLFGVPDGDVVTLGVAAVALILVASLASWIPARRVSRVDAAVSLRDQG